MSIRLRHLRVRAVTPAGLYGCDIAFGDGLNVIHAPNSSGKSLCLMSVLYALGLEGAFTSRQAPPLPPALTEALRDMHGETQPVVQSWVELEIGNAAGELVTVRRAVKDSARDHRLVTVTNGPALSGTVDAEATKQDYYVRRSGAAQDEAGFHRFLADEFLDLQLPEVPRFDGSRGPLYLECLVPAFFVEQKAGWRGVQLRMPTYLGIRDLSRRVLEFILGLDVAQKEIDRQRLLDQRRELSEKWSRIREAHFVALRSHRARVSGVPESAVPSLGGLHVPELHVLGDGQQWTAIGTAEAALATQLDDLVHHEIPTVAEVADALEAKLIELRELLQNASVRYRAVELEVQSQHEEIRAVDRRLRSIAVDLKRNQETKKLLDMGSDVLVPLGDSACPTCGQSVTDSLLPQDPEDVPMTLEGNIDYLKGQAKLFEDVRGDAAATLQAQLERREAIRADTVSLRRDIRATTESLNADGRQPSIEAVRQRLRVEDRLEEISQARGQFSRMLQELGTLADKFRDVEADISRLGPAGPTESDKSVLSEIQASVQEQLRAYRFSSVPPQEVQISDTLYRPVHDGFDLTFDVSASDMIRVIWAYLLAVLDAGSRAGGNHPGLLIFDEPRQQGARVESFIALLEHASTTASGDRQIIFATSEDEAETVDRIRELAGSFIEFDGVLLRPVSNNSDNVEAVAPEDSGDGSTLTEEQGSDGVMDDVD